MRTPLCPLVLSMLAAQPCRAHEVGRVLCDDAAARATLDRLLDRGLVRRRPVAGGPIYQLTRRGRGELRLQRMLWARVLVG